MRHRATKDLPARQRGAAPLRLFSVVSLVLIFALVAGVIRSAGDFARARNLKSAAALAPGKSPAPGAKGAATAGTPEQKALEAQPENALEHLRRMRQEGNGNAPDRG